MNECRHSSLLLSALTLSFQGGGIETLLMLAVFTARCYAEHVIVRASRPSIVCDVQVSWPHRLEFFDNNFMVD